MLKDDHVQAFTAMLQDSIERVGSTSTFARGLSPRIHVRLESFRKNAFQCALDEWNKIRAKCVECAFSKGCGGTCLAKGGTSTEDGAFYADRLERHSRENLHTAELHQDLLASECARMAGEAYHHARGMFLLAFPELFTKRAA